MGEGQIQKALSGFYYVNDGQQVYACRARGKHRHAGQSPLVGDYVRFTPLGPGEGALDEILCRKNQFHRPMVANIDLMVILASLVNPVTDPFLIDRLIATAEAKGCESLVCVNKSDLCSGEELAAVYRNAGYPAVCVSAETGEGIDQLRKLIAGKVCAFTGNTGVGKSSLLNALEPGFSLKTGQVSDKLGRGRHTTRHVELFQLSCGAAVADTPGFSSFEEEALPAPEELAGYFREFAPFRDKCRFPDCAHVKEKGCAVRQAVQEGTIAASRHQSYVRLYEQAKAVPEWAR